MPMIKTSEVTGAALDWLVAIAEGCSVYLRHTFINARALYVNHDGSTLAWHLSQQTNDPIIGNLETGATQPLPAYSTDWAHGGPILSREGISRTFDHSGLWVAYWTDGYTEGDAGNKWMQCDSSELVAGLRCHVASKLGDTVDVPEELLT